MRGLIVIACLLVAGPVEANPITSDDLSEATLHVSEQLEEPVGLVVDRDIGKLGLVKGDLIQSINGAVATVTSDLIGPSIDGAAVVHIELVRAGKPVSLKLALLPQTIDDLQNRDRMKMTFARLRDSKSYHLRNVTKQGKPAGVLLGAAWAIGHRAAVGDIVRKVNGKPTQNVDQLLAALEAGLAKPVIVLTMERAGRPFTYNLALETPPAADPELDALVDKIEKVSDTSYKVPKKLVDKLVANPLAVTKGARIVPALKNGKPVGMKLYAIRPSSLFGKLGLTNGDTIVSVNGMSTDSVEKGLEIYNRMRTAKQVKLELLRRGTPFTLEWNIK